LTASPLGALSFALPISFYYQAFTSSLGYLAIAGSFLWVVAMYFLASRFQRTILGEFLRGGLVGLNAAFNTLILYYLTEHLWFSGGLGLLVLLSSSLWVSRSRFFHPVLAWVNLFLPMSWLVSMPGLVIYVVNLIFAPVGYLHPLLRGMRVRFHTDWKTCTFTQYGGLIRPVKGFAGLNMGNFIFINHGWEHLLRHEIGHLFTLAAMGFIFHYLGGIDESYLQERYWEAYAEYLAESYNEPSASVLSMWR
jgi:hypothetical protein